MTDLDEVIDRIEAFYNSWKDINPKKTITDVMGWYGKSLPLRRDDLRLLISDYRRIEQWLTNATNQLEATQAAPPSQWTHPETGRIYIATGWKEEHA